MATAMPFEPVHPVLARLERDLAASTPEERAEHAKMCADLRARAHEMVPGEVVHARLEARIAQAAEIGARLRELGRDGDILMDSTPDEAQAYCDEVLGPGAVVILGSKGDASAAEFIRTHPPA